MAKGEMAEVKTEDKFEVENSLPVMQVTRPTKHTK